MIYMIKKTFYIFVALLATIVVLGSCVSKDRDIPYTGQPLIILDTDIGGCTDDLFALEMLYDYQCRGMCELLGVVVDRMGEECASVVDVMNTYFGYPNTPIGIERKGIRNPIVFTDYRGLSAMRDEKGELLFSCSVSDYTTLPDGWQLYRKLLASQPDHSVTICSIGFVSSLAQLLESQPDTVSPLSGVELVRRKVKRIVIMAGDFSEPKHAGYNFQQGPSYAATFMRLWPHEVEMIFSPSEVGEQVHYLRETMLDDHCLTDIHPIKQIYLQYFHHAYQSMWDPMVIIHAVEGDSLFTLSERGIVTLNGDIQTDFTPCRHGNCRYQIPGNKELATKMLEKIRRAKGK